MIPISIKDLSFSYPHNSPILSNVNLEVEGGKFLGILGHNGAGKTTLIDLIMGFKKLTAGSIHIFGEDPHGLERKHKDKVCFLSQDVSIKGNLTIESFLKLHSAFYSAYSKEEEKRLLEIFKIDSSIKVGALSLGQQKKVQIIAGISCLPKILIIDEITAVLDPETRDVFFREVSRIKTQRATSIILATNIAEDLVDRADNILFIRHNKAVLHHPSEIKKLFNIGQVA